MGESTLSDEDLLLAWAHGDGRAGKTLVGRHYESISRLFRFKVGEQEARDLTQATFEAVQKSRDSFRRESSFRAWLFGIARNKLLGHMRNHDRDKQRFNPDASSVADLGPSPSSVLDSERRQRLLLGALRRLPVDVQLMLELHYWEQMPIAEIAKVVEKPANTVRTQMRRGRLRLEELMRELAETPEQLEITLSGLEGWAMRVRAECGDDVAPSTA